MDIAAIRETFPILTSTVHDKPLVYLDNAATTQKPRAVLDAIVDFYSQSNSNVHRGVHYLSELASDRYEKAREAIQRFINASDSREVIFTRGTTESINIVADIVARQWLQEGDEIIVTEMEHHSNLVPWQMACRRAGASLKIVPFNDDGSLQHETLESLICEKTRLVALSHVSNVLGTINPVKRIIRTAHEREVPVLLDAAQSVPHLSIDVRNLDCDFLAFSGHKLYADTGIGVLYGKKKWLDAMQPSQFGGGMVSSVTLDETTCGDLPYKFEAGTPNIAGAISLAAAIDYLDEIGMEAIADHERAVMAYASEQLSELDGLSIYGTVGKCGALSFNLDTVNPYDAATLLDKMGIAVRSGTHCAEPVMQHYRITGALRASFGVYNTTEEVDALIHGIRKVQALLS